MSEILPVLKLLLRWNDHINCGLGSLQVLRRTGDLKQWVSQDYYIFLKMLFGKLISLFGTTAITKRPFLPNSIFSIKEISRKRNCCMSLLWKSTSSGWWQALSYLEEKLNTGWVTESQSWFRKQAASSALSRKIPSQMVTFPVVGVTAHFQGAA